MTCNITDDGSKLICSNCKAETNKLIGFLRCITDPNILFGGVCQKCWNGDREVIEICYICGKETIFDELGNCVCECHKEDKSK